MVHPICHMLETHAGKFLPSATQPHTLPKLPARPAEAEHHAARINYKASS
jgi:hypothetical protein